jgi:hypothetical protein
VSRALPLQILDAGTIEGYATWLGAFRESALQEPMMHPDYTLAFRGADEQALCLLFEDAGGRIMLPLLRRPLPQVLPGESLTDVITPYGYGGPFRDGTPDADAFWDAVDAWATTTGIVTLVARFSLFPDTLAPFRGGVIDVMENVVVDLTRPADRRYAEYEHKVRKNVQRAQREGLRVEIDTTGSRYDAFERVYRGTMERRAASQSFFFDREFFERFHHGLEGSFLYAHVLRDDLIISSELVLASPDRLYSFLGGTDQDYFPLRPNDLLKHEVIAWGAAHGRGSYVLGGGPQAGDGIFRYKRAFDPAGVVPFRIGTRIFLAEQYDVLLSARRRLAGPDWSPSPHFFPAYRAPDSQPVTAESPSASAR